MGTISLKSMIMNMLGKAGSPKKQSEKDRPKSFIEKQKAEEAVDRRDLGIKNVPLRKIVGSVGRYNDFDNRFRLKRNHEPYRLKRIKEAIEAGNPLPPVELYKIKDEYYVLDGNHRVAASVQLQKQTVNAHIVEYLPSKQTLENILFREKSDFEANSGLFGKIELTEVGQFGFLLEQIKKHQVSLEHITETPASLKSAAKDWYNTIYLPLAEIIKHSGLDKAFLKRTVADLYVYISYHQWHKGREERRYGDKLDALILRSMEKFRTQVMRWRNIRFRR